eukprot:6829793-Pyramimonas_sp.AAC.2
MQGTKRGINYHVSTATLRQTDMHLLPGDDGAAEEPKQQAPLALNAADVAAPKLTRTQFPHLRAFLQGATITGHRPRHITGNDTHRCCVFCGAEDEDKGHI